MTLESSRPPLAETLINTPNAKLLQTAVDLQAELSQELPDFQRVALPSALVKRLSALRAENPEQSLLDLWRDNSESIGYELIEGRQMTPPEGLQSAAELLSWWKDHQDQTQEYLVDCFLENNPNIIGEQTNADLLEEWMDFCLEQGADMVFFRLAQIPAFYSLVTEEAMETVLVKGMDSSFVYMATSHSPWTFMRFDESLMDYDKLISLGMDKTMASLISTTDRGFGRLTKGHVRRLLDNGLDEALAKVIVINSSKFKDLAFELAHLKAYGFDRASIAYVRNQSDCFSMGEFFEAERRKQVELLLQGVSNFSAASMIGYFLDANGNVDFTSGRSWLQYASPVNRPLAKVA